MFQAPVDPMIITSLFGPRPRPNGPLHPGLDFRCAVGQPVRAVAAGMVVKSYHSQNDPPTWKVGDPQPRVMGYGNNILIAHADGRLTRYCHLSRRDVEAGQHVEAGQVIGLGGCTGYSFGAHLHFELREDGGRSFRDPYPEFTHLNPVVL